MAYSSSIKGHYKGDFEVPNQKLAGFDLTQDEGLSQGRVCFDPMYEGFRLSMYCYFGNHSSTLRPDAAYKDRWKKESKAFETYLLQNGWHKEWNARQPIDEILDYHEDNWGIGVNYSKKHGNTICRLSLNFTPDQRTFTPENNGELRAWTACERSVSFFGGY
jgi:hypothetical protein